MSPLRRCHEKLNHVETENVNENLADTAKTGRRTGIHLKICFEIR